MVETTSSNVNMPLSERLSLKILALFLGTFLLAFFAFWAYGVVESYQEARAAEANIDMRPKTIVIDPRIQTELAQVIAFDSAAASPDVRDPFNDRTGISGLRAGTGGGSAGGAATTGGAGSGSGAATTGGGSGGSGPSTVTVPAEPILTAVEATRQRYNAWLDRARVGVDIELDPMVFSIEDLLPVGIVDGGNGRQEVMFFSEAANRTISFPVGTLFYDGWLTELRPEGVVFSTNDRNRSLRMRSWGRSIRGS
jgi:hypothetical protein